MKQREFVEAAHSFGASDARVLVRELLPNVLPSALVVVSLMSASVILLEAASGFLGLGDPDVISLDYQVNNAQRFIRVAWWMFDFSGAAIAVAVLGLNLLRDRRPLEPVRSALDRRTSAHASPTNYSPFREPGSPADRGAGTASGEAIGASKRTP